jgi:hypothetical protein
LLFLLRPPLSFLRGTPLALATLLRLRPFLRSLLRPLLRPLLLPRPAPQLVLRTALVLGASLGLQALPFLCPLTLLAAPLFVDALAFVRALPFLSTLSFLATLALRGPASFLRLAAFLSPLPLLHPLALLGPFPFRCPLALLATLPIVDALAFVQASPFVRTLSFLATLTLRGLASFLRLAALLRRSLLLLAPLFLAATADFAFLPLAAGGIGRSTRRLAPPLTARLLRPSPGFRHGFAAAPLPFVAAGAARTPRFAAPIRYPVTLAPAFGSLAAVAALRRFRFQIPGHGGGGQAPQFAVLCELGHLPMYRPAGTHRGGGHHGHRARRVAVNIADARDVGMVDAPDMGRVDPVQMLAAVRVARHIDLPRPERKPAHRRRGD